MKTTISKEAELQALQNALNALVELSHKEHQITVIRGRYVLYGKFGCATKCTYREMNEKLNGILQCVRYYENAN